MGSRRVVVAHDANIRPATVAVSNRRSSGFVCPLTVLITSLALRRGRMLCLKASRRPTGSSRDLAEEVEGEQERKPRQILQLRHDNAGLLGRAQRDGDQVDGNVDRRLNRRAHVVAGDPELVEEAGRNGVFGSTTSISQNHSPIEYLSAKNAEPTSATNAARCPGLRQTRLVSNAASADSGSPCEWDWRRPVARWEISAIGRSSSTSAAEMRLATSPRPDSASRKPTMFSPRSRCRESAAASLTRRALRSTRPDGTHRRAGYSLDSLDPVALLRLLKQVPVGALGRGLRLVPEMDQCGVRAGVPAAQADPPKPDSDVDVLFAPAFEAHVVPVHPFEVLASTPRRYPYERLCGRNSGTLSNRRVDGHGA